MDDESNSGSESEAETETEAESGPTSLLCALPSATMMTIHMCCSSSLVCNSHSMHYCLGNIPTESPGASLLNKILLFQALNIRSILPRIFVLRWWRYCDASMDLYCLAPLCSQVVVIICFLLLSLPSPAISLSDCKCTMNLLVISCTTLIIPFTNQ